ncbi:MAG: methylamine methyltransferase corrinoid protein reductive activase [Methanosarcinales archaeon]|jgi:methylamine methyltransferase corrinoid activation protein|nr:methylamine methyltransferase corrinoid protein reductive activase [Methanosarcinales archaeon]
MYAIALDLGTSGFRAQLIDQKTNETLKTVITMGHPLPGGNVIDHLEFAIVTGEDVANEVMLRTVKKILDAFNADLKDINYISVCGNPIQLSLFQNIEIRDLAYAGETKQKSLGVENVQRDARVFPANDLFKGVADLPNCKIIVPPAIKHEIGADALAMMTETDFISQTKPCLVTDYGTNAEMAIKVGDKIITASAAAGPSIEGQGIPCGMLAAPGAVSDVNIEGDYWRLTVLDEMMQSGKGDLVNPVTGEIIEKGDLEAVGITGTGVISCMSVMLKSKLMTKIPKLPNGKVILGKGIEITEKDVVEIGKAIGAIRAAQLTLMEAAGLDYDQLEYAYISGATGTYVDGKKAAYLGSVPNYAKNVIQFGNTSIGLARKLAIHPEKLEEVREMAKKIQADHLMMATSQTFKDIYICELSYWEQGMPMEMYDEMLKMFNLRPFPHNDTAPNVERRVIRDIDDVGEEGVKMVEHIGVFLEAPANGCIFCRKCEQSCPENAIAVKKGEPVNCIVIDSQKCLGSSCKRCITNCPKNAINHSILKVVQKEEY